MSTYSTRFAGIQLVPGWQSVFTAPPTGTVVLRDIELSNASGGVLTFQSQLSAPGGTSVSFHWGQVPSASSSQWEGRVVMLPNEQLEWEASGAGLSLIVSGYLLE